MRRSVSKPAPALPPHNASPSQGRCLVHFTWQIPHAGPPAGHQVSPVTCAFLSPHPIPPSSESEKSDQGPKDLSATPQLQERGLQQRRAIMRWKMWANPEPNEGLIHAVKICQLLVNSSSGPELGGRGGLCSKEHLGLYLGCCFSPLSLFFSFLECEYKVYGGAWSLFTPGANSPQLKAEMQRKTGPRSPQKAGEPGGGGGEAGGGAQEEVEGYLILNLLFFFF